MVWVGINTIVDGPFKKAAPVFCERFKVYLRTNFKAKWQNHERGRSCLQFHPRCRLEVPGRSGWLFSLGASPCRKTSFSMSWISYVVVLAIVAIDVGVDAALQEEKPDNYGDHPLGYLGWTSTHTARTARKQ